MYQLPCPAPAHVLPRLLRSFAFALALAVLLPACFQEKKELLPDPALTFESFIGSGIIFGGIPTLEFPVSGLPKDYTLECASLRKLLIEELNVGHVTSPLEVRKHIGPSQYQQMMVSVTRNSMPHWTYLDELRKYYPYHGFAVFMQPSPTTEFRNHLIVEDDDNRALQTISETRGSIRFIVVNMRGLNKLSLDVTLRKASRQFRLFRETEVREVAEALREPRLRIKQEWYPPYPTKEDLQRDIILEFIAILNKRPGRR